MQSMSSCAPFVYVTACENAVARSDLRTIAQCFGASQVQHHRAFYSRKEPNLLLDFYSLKAKKKPCNHSVFVDKAVNQIITATESAIGEKPNCKDAMG